MNPNFSIFPNLETDRLKLRSLHINDALEIYQLRADLTVAELTGKEPAKDINEAKSFIHKIQNLISDNACIYWAICYKGEDDLIGAVCFWNFDTDSNSIEIGYELLPQYQHKGIMSEALKTVIDFGFEVIKAKTITAFPSGNNPASVIILEKAGFKLSFDHYKNSHKDVQEMLTYILHNKDLN